MVTVAIEDNQLKLKDQTQEYIDRGKDLRDDEPGIVVGPNTLPFLHF